MTTNNKKTTKAKKLSQGGSLKRKLQKGGKFNGDGKGTAQSDSTYTSARGYANRLPKAVADSINLAEEQKDYDRTGKLTNPGKYGTIDKKVVPIKTVQDLRIKKAKAQNSEKKQNARGGSLRKSSRNK